MSAPREPGRPGLWARVASVLFHLYPPGYRRRHGHEQRALLDQLLGAERDPAARKRVARKAAVDAARTLPRAWGRAVLDVLPVPRGRPRLDGLVEDVRHSLRSFLRQPVVPLVAVLSIALGIGFNASLFSAIHALLLRPMPGVTEPDRVVEIGRTNDGEGFDSFSYPDMVSLRESVEALDYVAAWEMAPLSYGTEEGGERVIGMSVSAGYFEALGALPGRGRAFGPEEDVIGGPATAVVSDRFWRTRLGADTDVIGRTILVNRVPVTVLGVAPEGFTGHFPLVQTDLWLPYGRKDIAAPGADPRLYTDRGWISHQVIGRLAEGATLAQANAEVGAVMASLAEANPETNLGRGAAVARLGPVPGGGTAFVRGFLVILMGLALLVLLVAAANVAGMLVARAAAREKEVAIRRAIGSGRARLVQRTLVETLALALAGAGGGALIANWATGLITTIEGPGIALTVDLTPDGIVFVFAFALAVLTGVLVGIVPALQASRLDILSALKLEGRSGSSGQRARSTFVALQVGVSVVLLAAGGLLVRSLLEATKMSGGFEPAGVHLTSVDLSLDGYATDELPTFQEELRSVLLRRPGVDAVGLAIDLPLDLSENGAPVWPQAMDDEERGFDADFNAVSPGYFETLRIPILRGRSFDATDRAESGRVVIVSEALARRAWGDANPIGRTLRWSRAEDEPRTVIGVAGEVKNQTLGESEDGMVYLPLTQRLDPATYVLARGAAVDGGLLRSALLEVDPRLTISPPQTLEGVTAVSLLPARLAAGMAGLLGALALFLASLGVYGVIAHAMAQRTREIGLRIALGARASEVIRMTIARGLRIVLPGVVLGGAAAIGVAQLLRSLLLGISPADPATYVAVGTMLLASVVLACWIPGRKAAAVDPMEALKGD